MRQLLHHKAVLEQRDTLVAQIHEFGTVKAALNSFFEENKVIEPDDIKRVARQVWLSIDDKAMYSAETVWDVLEAEQAERGGQEFLARRFVEVVHSMKAGSPQRAVERDRRGEVRQASLAAKAIIDEFKARSPKGIKGEAERQENLKLCQAALDNLYAVFRRDHHPWPEDLEEAFRAEMAEEENVAMEMSYSLAPPPEEEEGPREDDPVVAALVKLESAVTKTNKLLAKHRLAPIPGNETRYEVYRRGLVNVRQ
jgi:hypothetical protein